MASARVFVVIPAYEPDETLLVLCRKLVQIGITDLIIVDDGSGREYEKIFQDAKDQFHCTVLKHPSNFGKGKALKTAFAHILNLAPDAAGCVTADSDGQHTPEDILNCMNVLRQNPDQLILGCRSFNSSEIPLKSRFGNKLTEKVFQFLCDMKLSDTQTGLRGIPRDFMEYLLDTPGERFEFETNMLLECRNRIEIKEIPIATIYDSKEEHRTHFDPIRDSIKIYKIFGKEFLKFLISSLSSSVLDLILFSIFCRGLKTFVPLWYIAIATVFARVISASYNYLINYKIVFQSGSKYSTSYAKYFLLAVVQMVLSAFGVTVFSRIFMMFPEAGVKIVVDTLLFFVSYKIQQKYIFR